MYVDATELIWGTIDAQWPWRDQEAQEGKKRLGSGRDSGDIITAKMPN